MIKHVDIVPGEGKEAFKNCKLGREPYADILTDIISSYADGFVFALNNEWGVGKTTFIKMWREKLQFLGFQTLYYNVWENDFEKNVLVALISELEELKDSSTKVAYKAVIEKAALLTKKLGPGIVKTAIKQYAGVDSEDLQKIIEGTAEVGFETLEAEIKSYAKRKSSLKEFRQCLQDFVGKVTPEKPVIFFIDELDRCRPNYAVEVLEEVKHLFSVPGIVFVLSIDKEQLGHAVRGVYGSEQINADEYLRRFIDLEYNLPSPPNYQILDYLYNFYGIGEFFLQDRPRQFVSDESDFRNFAMNLFSVLHLNFRQKEKLFAHLSVVLNICNGKSEIFPPVLFLLVYLKNFHTELYADLKNKRLTSQELFFSCEKFIPETLYQRKEYKPFYFYFLLLADLYNNSIHKNRPLLQKIGHQTYATSLKSKFGDTDSKIITDLFTEVHQKYCHEGSSLDEILKKIELLEMMRN